MIGAELGGYRILDELGSGGMGTVYRALDTSLDRIVAVKVLNPELARNAALVERFRMEARAQASLNHSNIAMLHAFLTQGAQAWMVMEYVDGETIAHMLARRGLLPPQVAIPLFKQALLGIGYAHRRGIVHRDIKPANLMVNSYGMVKVMDFGIAKVMGGQSITRTGAYVGSVAYMSPEQVMNSAVDIRSDMYSLGVTLFEMLTAHLPFEGAGDFQIMSSHVNQPPPRPTRYYPHIPPEIENAILKALSKAPDSRFQSAEEFGTALDTTLLTPPQPVPPPRSTRSEFVVPPPRVSPAPVPNPPPVLPIPPVYPPVQVAPAPPAATGQPADYRRTIVIIALAILALIMVLAAIFSSGITHEAKLTPPSITPPPPPAPEPAAPVARAVPGALKILTFDTSANQVPAGQLVRLSWSVQGASEVTITPDMGNVQAQGSSEVRIARTTEFKLIARNARGDQEEHSVKVEVEAPKPDTAETILDRVRSALGGDRLDTVTDWYGQGQTTDFTSDNGDVRGIVMRWRAPGALRLDVTPSQTSAGRDVLFDGTQVFERDIPVHSEGSRNWDPVNGDPKQGEPEYVQFWKQFAFTLPPMLFRRGGASSTRMVRPGVLELASATANRVLVAMDSKTGLPLNMSYEGLAFGGSRHSGPREISLAGWRATRGVTCPFIWTFYEGSKKVGDIRLRDIRINTGLTLEQLRNLPPSR